MARPGRLLFVLLLAAAGGCAQANLPSPGASAVVPPASVPKAETTAGAPPAPGLLPVETSTMVAGTPIDVYSMVARAALNCWFGADGPLKPTHVFQAETVPPSSGGNAEIVLHERDATMPNQRGVRAFRVAFAANAGGVVVVSQPLKVTAPMAQAMQQDVETWAKGGTGCQLRVLMPPKAAAPAQPPPGKRKAYSR